MHIEIRDTKTELGKQAAEDGAAVLRRALAEDGNATVLLATGMSQFEMLAELVKAPDIAWDRVTAFHLDEYVGLPVTHPASFRKYLRERFVAQLPGPLAAFHEINGENDPPSECERLNALISGKRIAVAFVGIGENGHLAFNDPPADFDTEQPYIVVDLDDACRRQQLGEGWFPTFDDVPAKAISMSIRQILKAERILCVVPDARKAEAVRNCLAGPVSNLAPASALQDHPATTVYLDPASAALLPKG
ncbi:MAG: glucosamine-6-phosphate deaminase [Capsulimonadales bacterium]|nr:glucosamine-6-phosphate deaminase [Capsulimonadales bacterium]